MKQWRCEICGYIFVGEHPPDICPVCGVGAEAFEELEAEAAGTGTAGGGLQEALFQIPCGLFLVSCFADGRANGMINNTVLQMTEQLLSYEAYRSRKHELWSSDHD